MDCYEGKDCFLLAKKARAAYSKDELRSMKVSGDIEAEYFMKLTRLEEIMLYAKRMRMKKLGIAFCVGLSKEAMVLDRILASKGFEVHSACCKICGLDKAELGVRKLESDALSEAVCNPIGQALRLNACGTDMNIVVGLCMGHDILFARHSEAPSTTFIVKDRVLSHNPVGAIYSAYYLETKFGLKDDG
ncbi:MAG TPA: DUF1847 domain-containing protein [Thermoplasmata archaeon]